MQFQQPLCPKLCKGLVVCVGDVPLVVVLGEVSCVVVVVYGYALVCADERLGGRHVPIPVCVEMDDLALFQLALPEAHKMINVRSLLVYLEVVLVAVVVSAKVARSNCADDDLGPARLDDVEPEPMTIELLLEPVVQRAVAVEPPADLR